MRGSMTEQYEPMKRSTSLGLAVALLLTSFANAAVTLPPFFSDHMVLQRDREVPIWGKAAAGEKVTIEYSEKTASTTADKDGKWTCKLPALPGGDAASMTIKGESGDAIVLKDVLVGDVWICSGQSNMQMQVKSCINAEKDIASATDAKIRVFRLPMKTSVEPRDVLEEGKWVVCSPQTAGEFTAAGYFFGREIRAKENVPVGLIDNSWGGMPVESFTSKEILASDPDFQPILDRKAAALKIPQADRDKAAAAQKAWDEKYVHSDPGNEGEKNGWANADFNDGDWKTMELPKHWEDAGLKIDGSVWFRKTVEIPADWKGQEITLFLGGIDDFDVAYVNGKQVGHTEGIFALLISRAYAIPTELTKDGKLTIAVRVFDRSGPGGFFGTPASMQLQLATAKQPPSPVSLAGEWKYKVEKEMPQIENAPPRPGEPTRPTAPNLGSNIYNAMVNPLIPYAIKGAIWYQGESNADRAEQYRKLFPAMIKDWRDRWGQGEFPFYFVQLANFGVWKPRPEQPAGSNWAELREAQTMTLKASPNTGMAVIIDIGDTKDIHPRNKQDVGKRLALNAEHFAYGKGGVEFAGPMYESMKVDGDKIRVKFTHATGLMSKDGSPKCFAVAGEDRKFHWADATIEGDEVVLSSKEVAKPIAVRYAWEDDPQVNVFNGDGLPMCPFRTDDWKMLTAGAK